MWEVKLQKLVIVQCRQNYKRGRGRLSSLCSLREVYTLRVYKCTLVPLPQSFYNVFSSQHRHVSKTSQSVFSNHETDWLQFQLLSRPKEVSSFKVNPRSSIQSYRVPTLLEVKNSRSFPVQFQNVPGAFGHSSQPNIKHIWTTIVTKRLPNIIECNQCQYLLYKVCCKNICTVLCFYMHKSTYYTKNSRSNIKFQEFSRFTIFQEFSRFSRWVGTLS